MLVNATPIRSADGTVESMVVTMQDLAALEELERLRAEFLSMVSHELRAPLTSIIGSTATLQALDHELGCAGSAEVRYHVVGRATKPSGLIAHRVTQAERRRSVDRPPERQAVGCRG